MNICRSKEENEVFESSISSIIKLFIKRRKAGIK
jgi:hypothetical protein